MGPASGVTFAEAAAEWLRFIAEDRGRKPSTLKDYRSALNAHLLPAFGDRPVESITAADVERWRRGLTGLSNRSKNKLLIHGLSDQDLKVVLELIVAREQEIRDAWTHHFGS